ncbi:hypothetical protein [Aeromicrobium sp. 9AM]|uniref:hypothetical protein n=1 Tax=Aeromicrobium sp. 9AM TaxID=2653126 RepID=UPI001356B88F|nr:hypothetical protein [Aeromicrobium sp. 9AM]
MVTEQVVLAALQQAAAAHGVHEAEELGGVYDQEWPRWYAAHMTETLAKAGHPADAMVLQAALESAAAAHAAHEKELGEKDPDWPEWYAAHMTPVLNG